MPRLVHCLTGSPLCLWSSPVKSCKPIILLRRHITIDGRQRLSGHWAPNARGTNADPKNDDVHALLIKTGFIEQAYSGVYQLLPLGLRVQEKIERLVDKHMRALGASKLSLSALSSEALWRQSGRLQNDSSELVRLRSRAKDAFLLSPTHEEEITKLVARTVRSAKQLPLRVYQISRKYRDELRPRSGLLRAREFLMKDLYTFHATEEAALETYAEVKTAYIAFFTELGLPYLTAEADSGSMGGSQSHEFHFPSPNGEDTVFSCNACNYVANEELVEAYRPAQQQPRAASPPTSTRTWFSTAKQGTEQIIVIYNDSAGTVNPSESEDPNAINQNALKKIIPDLDSGNDSPNSQDNPHDIKSPLKGPKNSLRIIYDVDTTPISPALHKALTSMHAPRPVQILHSTTSLTGIHPGSHCPRCRNGVLSSQRAIELGHTFHLGTRYSSPLGALVPSTSLAPALQQSAELVPMQMGCHGIGVTRLIAASAGMLADEKGLNWPVKIAPFAVMIIPTKHTEVKDIADVYDTLSLSLSPNRDGDADALRDEGLDTCIDDRRDMTLVQRLKDADLVGYPVLIVLGRGWIRDRRVEVQCRRLGVYRNDVALEDAVEVVRGLIARLARPAVNK